MKGTAMKLILDMAAAVAVTVTAAALISAPIAVASPEGQFIDELTTDNATLPGKTPSEMVAAGNTTCDHLRGGTSVLDEMAAVNRTYGFDGGTLFVSAATTNLCPNFASQQQSQAQERPQPYGPDTCVSGYVWREANPSDHVCVTPDVRTRTAQENAAAASRVDPAGAYGPNSCKQGYVWRNAYQGDAVCVSPGIRDDDAADNAAAASRVAH